MAQTNTKIKQLSDVTISRIAAGEVIERPSSVIKELVENAIDAGATKLDITLETAGKNLIVVSDNGSGMGREDLALSIQRHTTSKLKEDDIMDVRSFGFRGEALPSIGSISRMHIITYDSASSEAHEIHIEGGEVHPIKPALHNIGTRVEVRDLFFATPARLKFLRSDRTELNACIDGVKKIAMSVPHVALSLTHDGKTILKLRAASQLERVEDILGKEFVDNAAPVLLSRDGIDIEGWVSVPTFHRASSEDQYLFVNSRPVKDKLLSTAVRVAYQDFIESGRHPVVVLFVQMDPRYVDVNVHPAKAEVRFHDVNLIRGLIIGGIRDALSANSHKVSTVTSTKAMEYLSQEKPNLFDNTGGYTHKSNVPSPQIRQASLYASAPSPQFRSFEQSASPIQEREEVVEKCPLGAASAQLHKTYIISQTDDSIIIVDQHAAHERITYERLKEQMAAGSVVKQRLLIPEVVELPDKKRADILLEHKDRLAVLGLVFEVFGEKSIIVNEVPAIIGAANVQSLVQDIADNLSEFGEDSSLPKLIEHIVETYACHHSIRAGKYLTISEMNSLLRQMENTPFSGQCNHGRPTYVELKLKDIEKLFGRT